MRILDANNNEITSPDLSLGVLVEESIFIAHHEAIEPVEEQWHYEVVAEYDNGGKDVRKVVDVPGVEARDAWDEYETIQRYVPYTDEELAKIEEDKNVPSALDDITAMMVDHEYRLTLIELGISESEV